MTQTRTAIIVAHGQPSDPAPAEADLARLTAAVATLMPGWQLGSATLAAPGALERTIQDIESPIIFPFFMAEGWFTRKALPDRLAAAGAEGLTRLPAFGTMAATHELAVRAARMATLGREWKIPDTTLILAAHGSGRSRAPAEAAEGMANSIRAALPFREIRLGFIEEAPGLQEVATDAGARTLCLPLFVARWGHVVSDIPAALAAAAYRGPCLAPLGTRREVPGIIAAALAEAAGEG
ncbi:MAG: cobalamin biosynthesis protein CbiX [Rhodobacteraceae bacterium]|nr:cobalamin biosynthesis protein CbiX [Paracoccaceae bacterium]